MNIGDYVRTKDGNIAKYIRYDGFYNFDNYVLDETKGINNDLLNEIVIKSSPNIIDLIEEGDYVNGYKVLNVLDFNDNSKMLSLEKIYDNKITSEDIKSILTKEQFESMEYKVGDE